MGKNSSNLDFRSLLIGEIAGSLAHKSEGMSNDQFYELVSNGCKILKVEPPTKKEWADFISFIEWHNKVLMGQNQQ